MFDPANEPEAPLGETIAEARAEPISFVSTLGVSFISVEYDGMQAQTAFRDGIFLGDYASSTTDGAAFELRHNAGWPKPPRLQIQEHVPAASPGYGVLYDVDFATLPPQDLAAVDQVLVDGKRWNRKGDDFLVSCDVVNGVGLRLVTNAGASTPDHIALGYPQRCALTFPLAQLADYDPEKPVLVEIQFAEVIGSFLGGEHQAPIIGLIAAADDDADITASEAETANTLQWFGAVRTRRQSYGIGGPVDQVVDSTLSSATRADHAFALLDVAIGKATVSYHSAYAGDWPALSDLTFASVAQRLAGATPNLSVLLTFRQTVGFSTALTITLKRMRISQPGAA